MIGSFSSMSSTTNRRLAFSAAANAANAAVSALLGRPRVSLHDVRAWLLRPYRDSPWPANYIRPHGDWHIIDTGVSDRAAMLAVFARGDRQQRSVVQENPSALPQDRQTEFSNARCCPQLGQRKSRTGPPFEWRQVRCGVVHATL